MDRFCFLSHSQGAVSWEAVAASVTENYTRENIERIFKLAKVNGYDVFISPHYFYPTDSGWKSTDRLRPKIQDLHLCAKRPPGFPNSGADWPAAVRHTDDDETKRQRQPHRDHAGGDRPLRAARAS